ncbi:SDR family NAD(P)-dependent oxidoreductase [Streptomyces sp. NPDC057695]|uniref:SDR family NAD(P)-dependent oxidoreductase n=1 Tax=unclassified Streptomyces TaxID=2593676 RepID=UPI00363E7CE3
MGNFLAGKVVAVTGAGRGIGRAVALACAAEGAKVVVNDYGVSIEGGEPTSEIAQSVVKEIEAGGGTAVAVADDISTMAGGQRIVDVALAEYGRLDGVVCVAGILRERMLFNMSEEEWDPVVATHLKGTFTVFRAASAVMRRQRTGTLIGFTSGNHQGSVAQANYSAAKGGIISLVRSAALGLHKYGVTANAVAPVARTRMSANVPMELTEIGEPEDVAALVVYLLSERARAERITGQVYTIAGPKIAVWAQPRELRAGYAEGGWTPERIADFLPGTVGTDPMPMLARLEEMARAAAAGDRPNAGAAPDAEARTGDTAAGTGGTATATGGTEARTPGAGARTPGTATRTGARGENGS